MCYAGQVQAHLFLIRALQGYRRTPCMINGSGCMTKKNYKKLTADMMGMLFSVYKTLPDVFNVGSGWLALSPLKI